MSCCATPHKGAYNNISANFICLCFSVLSLFVSYLSCSFCNSSVYQKVCFIRSCQRGRDGKGKGISLPFSVFLVPFVTVQKERPSLFPWKRNVLIPAFKARETAVLFSKAKMVLCCTKYTYSKCFFRIAQRSVRDKAGSPALL